jgi:hypothetical protein
MIRISTYLWLLSATFLGGCKALEPIEQSFFLGKFVDQKVAEPVVRETYPVLVFRTPGYEIWSKKNANLEVGDALHPLSVGQVEVIELRAGVHHLKVRPEEGGLDFCDLKLTVNANSTETPAYVEVFERYNPTGQILSVVLAELEATSKYPLEPGQVCFGRFGMVQGTLPEGTDLKAPLTAQADQRGPQGR